MLKIRCAIVALPDDNAAFCWDPPYRIAGPVAPPPTLEKVSVSVQLILVATVATACIAMLACGPAAPTGQETSASEITPTPIAIPFNQGATQAQQQVEPASTPDNISTNQQNDGSAQETRDGITMSDDEWYDAQMLKIREGGHSIGTVVAEGYFWRGCSELSNARYNARKLERNRQYDREMFYANGPGAGWGTDTSINGFEAAAQTLEYSDDPRRFCTILEAQIERERARVNEEINSILTRTPIPRVTPVTPPTPTPIPSPTPTVYEAACDNPTLGSKIWDGTQWDCEYYRDNQEAMKTERHPSPWYYWQLLCDDVPYEQYVRNHCAGAAKAAKIPAPTHYTHWDHLCNNTNPGIDTAKLPLAAPVHGGHRQEMIACSVYYNYRDQMPEKMPDPNLMMWSYNKCYEVDESSDDPQAYWCKRWKAEMHWANITSRQLP